MTFTEAQRQAVRNLTDNLDISAKLPHRVIAVGYKDFYVMDFENLFRPKVVELFKALIRLEGSTTAVLARFEAAEQKIADSCNDLFFVLLSTEIDDYCAFVRRNIVEFGKPHAVHDEMRAPWMIFAERIGACSDLGSWCLYGQKFAEIALLGFKEKLDVFMENKLYSEFGIEKLSNALKRDTFFGDPGNDYSKKQRAILGAAYLCGDNDL